MEDTEALGMCNVWLRLVVAAAVGGAAASAGSGGYAEDGSSDAANSGDARGSGWKEDADGKKREGTVAAAPARNGGWDGC